MAEGIDPLVVERWSMERRVPEELRAMLVSEGYDEASIRMVLEAVGKAQRGRRQWKGFACAGGGAMLGFISCVLSLVNPVPDLYGLFLYGFTSVAMVLIVAGLYLVLE
jgi:hypothetical protein